MVAGEVAGRERGDREEGAVARHEAVVDPERQAGMIAPLLAPFGQHLGRALGAADELEVDDPGAADVLQLLLEDDQRDVERDHRDAEQDELHLAAGARSTFGILGPAMAERLIEGARRRALAGCIACAAGIAAIAALAFHVPALERLDEDVLNAISTTSESPVHDIAFAIEQLMDPPGWAAAAPPPSCSPPGRPGTSAPSSPSP